MDMSGLSGDMESRKLYDSNSNFCSKGEFGGAAETTSSADKEESMKQLRSPSRLSNTGLTAEQQENSTAVRLTAERLENSRAVRLTAEQLENSTDMRLTAEQLENSTAVRLTAEQLENSTAVPSLSDTALSGKQKHASSNSNTAENSMSNGSSQNQTIENDSSNESSQHQIQGMTSDKKEERNSKLCHVEDTRANPSSHQRCAVRVTLWRRVRGAVQILIMFWSALLGVCCFHGVLLPFMLFRITAALYRRAACSMVYSWIIYCAGLLEYLLGIRMVITGDAMLPGERSLIIMNHRTRLDWMYFWSVLVRESGVSTEKIILKSMLKKIPGAGWAMQVGAFMFINRKWEEDKVIFSKLINYFADINYRTQVLLFPEGTDLTERTRKKSDEFARKNHVAPYEYVLHPRTTGFSFLANQMRQNEHLDAVYDVTVGYPFNIPQKEADLAKGNFPKEVHFHIKRHTAQSLPLNEDGLNDWCKTRWAEKEERLKLFYEQGKFIQSTQDNLSAGDNSDTSSADRQKEKAALKARFVRDVRAQRMLKLALVYWSTFVAVIVWMLYNFAIVRYYMLFQMAFFIFMSHKYGGFEMFQVDYYNRFFKTKQSHKKKQS